MRSFLTALRSSPTTSCKVDEERFEDLVQEFRALIILNRLLLRSSRSYVGFITLVTVPSHTSNSERNEADFHSLSSEMSKPLNRALGTA